MPCIVGRVVRKLGGTLTISSFFFFFFLFSFFFFLFSFFFFLFSSFHFIDTLLGQFSILGEISFDR